MKDHEPAEDTAIRDISIVVGIAVLLYISSNITPINVETLSSGEVATSIFSYFGFSEKLTLVQTFFLSIKNTLAVFAMIFLAGIFWTTIKIREIHHKNLYLRGFEFRSWELEFSAMPYYIPNSRFLILYSGFYSLKLPHQLVNRNNN